LKYPRYYSFQKIIRFWELSEATMYVSSTGTSDNLLSNLTKTARKWNFLKLMMSDVRFEVFMAVTMKNGVFWDVMPCGSCKNRRFGGT
jgi:hypothetical protein